jgi:L-amino acid N-acyltransferase YncA
VATRPLQVTNPKLSGVKIVPATHAHSDEIWQIFHEVVAAGDTYVFDPKTTRDQALSYWLSPEAHTFVALDGSQVCGTYILKQNQPGLGSHVANASYMVAASGRGRGIGSLLCTHSLDQARRFGFQGRPIQYGREHKRDGDRLVEEAWLSHCGNTSKSLPAR